MAAGEARGGEREHAQAQHGQRGEHARGGVAEPQVAAERREEGGDGGQGRAQVEGDEGEGHEEQGPGAGRRGRPRCEVVGFRFGSGRARVHGRGPIWSRHGGGSKGDYDTVRTESK
ncbi:hypothetical protein SLA_6425 [Streptomyces laurentii]|uniref:Uncharacterized protein n=1 Tax=Streptomyces laurentii TaxID=39478 RepID=A0A160P8R7_STRLU|nr:hypothetical protein SLA_6425 [Streptomyces laurentii]